VKRGSNIPKSLQKAARKTSERLELIGQEMTEERAARPDLPSTPRNPRRAARRTWKPQAPIGPGMVASRCVLSLGSLGGYNTTQQL
jgi:hypothetical protein